MILTSESAFAILAHLKLEPTHHDPVPDWPSSVSFHSLTGTSHSHLDFFGVLLLPLVGVRDVPPFFLCFRVGEVLVLFLLGDSAASDMATSRFLVLNALIGDLEADLSLNAPALCMASDTY